jgi:exo-beta-1,3-glucanase (GH17 family)
MNTFDALNMKFGNAICYSGFRDGQHPGAKTPSYAEIKEDLQILQTNWKYLRIYDCDEHAKTVLKVIRKEKFDFKVMLGAYITAEMNNFGCPWGGGTYSQKVLEKNRKYNQMQIEKLILWANMYPDIINCLSVGNEACVDWTDHYVPVRRVASFAKKVRENCPQPVTFCENYVPWLNKLEPLVVELDFISVHTYPVWEYKHIHEAIQYTKDNYYAVASRYPRTPVVITEAGWSTNSNGRGIHPELVSEEIQRLYYHDLMDWVCKENILTYVFEAFDEKWKGSADPREPEKHWGLFHSDRTPKLVAKDIVSPVKQKK